MEYVDRAAKAAKLWHTGQVRKYSDNVPYFTHPERVAIRIARHQLATIVMVCAAYLHDVMEDCGVSFSQISLLFDDYDFGLAVATMVEELTNPSKRHQELSRAERKAMDRAHIKEISVGARMVKLADRTDNMNEIGTADPKFAKLYLQETELLQDVLAGTDRPLELELHHAMRGLRAENGFA